LTIFTFCKDSTSREQNEQVQTIFFNPSPPELCSFGLSPYTANAAPRNIAGYL